MNIYPITPIRPNPNTAQEFVSAPYDCFSEESARDFIDAHPKSCLNIILPEVALGYLGSRITINRMLAEGTLIADFDPCYYLWRMQTKSHTQIGLVASVSCDDYLQGHIFAHEQTRTHKVQDRKELMRELGLQTGVVELAYQSDEQACKLKNELYERLMKQQTIYEIELEEVQHSIWCISNKDDICALQELISTIDRCAIADGHHRTQAASELYLESRNQALSYSDTFLAVLFDVMDLQAFTYELDRGIPCAGSPIDPVTFLFEHHETQAAKSTYFYPKAASGIFFKSL